MLAFFGLSSEDRIHLFNQLHEITFHSNGGYTWDIVYNMPVWLRRLTFKKMQEWFAEQNKGGEEYLVNADNPASQISIPAAVQKVAGASKEGYKVKTSKKK